MRLAMVCKHYANTNWMLYLLIFLKGQKLNGAEHCNSCGNRDPGSAMQHPSGSASKFSHFSPPCQRSLYTGEAVRVSILKEGRREEKH